MCAWACLASAFTFSSRRGSESPEVVTELFSPPRGHVDLGRSGRNWRWHVRPREMSSPSPGAQQTDGNEPGASAFSPALFS